MAAKLNGCINQVLEQLIPMETGKKLTITYDGSFHLFHKDEEIAENLTLGDLKAISRQAKKLEIVQLVDISNLIFEGQIRETDAYIKIEDDVARAFLHLICKIKFNKNPVVATSQTKVAT